MNLPNEGRFWAKVQKSDGCWEWLGTRYPNDGYGKAAGTMAHRIAYQFVVGPIPEGLQLDHLCRNTGCVNPAHLEPVTQLENMRRGRRATKQFCDNGHPRNSQNIRIEVALRSSAATPATTWAPLPRPSPVPTRCKYGHEFDAENTYYFPDGRRGCRECMRASYRRRYAADPEPFRARSRARKALEVVAP